MLCKSLTDTASMTTQDPANFSIHLHFSVMQY